MVDMGERLLFACGKNVLSTNTSIIVTEIYTSMLQPLLPHVKQDKAVAVDLAFCIII